MGRTALLPPAIMSGQIHFVLSILLSITHLGFWLATHRVIPGCEQVCLRTLHSHTMLTAWS